MSCFQVSLDGFRAKRFNCLVATDVAGRGIDIPVCPCSSLPNSMWNTPCYRGFLVAVGDIIRVFNAMNGQISNNFFGCMWKGSCCNLHGLKMMCFNTLYTLNIVYLNT